MLRVATYNMLMNRKDEELPEVHRWPARKGRLFQAIKRLNADLIASQELYASQLKDVLEQIGEDFAFVGRRCESDPLGGEVNGFFYRKARLEKVGEKIWFLSDTPERSGSIGPYAKKPRTLTMVKFRDKQSDKVFHAVTAHFSFHRPEARLWEVQFSLERINQVASPVLFLGDFNTFPNMPDRVKEIPFNDGPSIEATIKGAGFADARDVAVQGHSGPQSSSTEGNDGIPGLFRGTGIPGLYLDHIYVKDSSTEKVRVLAHAIDGARIGGEFPSDHLPVIAEIRLESV